MTAAPALSSLALPEREGIDYPPLPHELGRHHHVLHHILGFDCMQRNNLHLIESNTLLYAAGNVLVVLEVDACRRRYVLGDGDQGIGCIAVHPSRTSIAVGKKGRNPSILIYSYPELDISKRLGKGAERAYANLAFDSNGTILASLSSSPDFGLTLWDWQEGSIILHCKAFGQDVYNISFSPHDAGSLVTSGMGHIRFWKMAKTFTGLKLQGEIGKFGRVELSDVDSIAILPDGKVLSSTDSGALLLWEGQFIKARFVRPGGNLCHAGAIYVVRLERDEKRFLTAGEDGWLRWWGFATIDTAEPDGDQSLDVEIEPLDEMQFGGGDAKLYHLVKWTGDKGRSRYFLQDLNGAVWSYMPETKEVKQILDTHAGKISGMELSSVRHIAVTGGLDGTVRCWQYVQRRQVYCSQFNQPVTALRWAPATLDGTGGTMLVGFQDGVVRLLYALPEAWKLLLCYKPHVKAVTLLRYSTGGQLVCTCGMDQSLFLMQTAILANSTQLEYTPVGFVPLPDNATDASWKPDDKALLLTLADGQLLELDFSDPNTWKQDTSTSFELSVPTRYYRLEISKPVVIASKAATSESALIELEKPSPVPGESTQCPLQAKVQNVSPPIPVQALYHPAFPNEFIVAIHSPIENALYRCGWSSQAPLYKWSIEQSHDSAFEGRPAIKTMRLSPLQSYLILGFEDGSVHVCPLNNPAFFLRIAQQDGMRGSITGAALSFDESCLLSASTNGLIFVDTLHRAGLSAEIQLRAAEDGQNGAMQATRKREPDHAYSKRVEAVDGNPTTAGGFKIDEEPIKESAEITALVTYAEVPDDITDMKAYSLQEAKQKTEEDLQRKLADAKRREVLQEIEKMREELEAIMDENSKLPPDKRLDSSAFILEEEYHAELREQGKQMIKEVHEKLAEETAMAEASLKQVEDFFLGNVETEEWVLSGIQDQTAQVSTFHTLKLPQETQEALHRMRHSPESLRSAESVVSVDGDVADGEGPEIADSAGQEASPRGGAAAQGHEQSREQLSSSQLRRLKRQERKEAMEALMREKPDPNEADPKDVEAIAYAETHMGDYKLKSLPDYEVPEDQRVTASKKQEQIYLLEEKMFKAQENFNNKVRALRDRKTRTIKLLRDTNQELRKLDQELGQPTARAKLSDPCLVPDEWPELRSFHTEEDLAIFAAEVKRVGIDKARAPPVTAFPKDVDPLEKLYRIEESAWTAEKQAQKEAAEAVKRIEEAKDKAPLEDDILTVRDRAVRKTHLIGLQMQRTRMEKNAQTEVADLDEAIHALRRQQTYLNSDLKADELKMFLYKDELKLLQGFDSRDAALAARLNKVQGEKREIGAAVAECYHRINSKEKDMENAHAKEAMLLKSFGELVPSSASHQHGLLRIYKRKMRRLKKSDAASRAGSEEEEEVEVEEEEDDYDWDDDDIEQDDSCPPGCEVAVYQKVLALREKRLDQEEIIRDFQKGIEELRRLHDRHLQRQKQIDREFQAIERESRTFQAEKQTALNQLDVVVPLTLNQIFCLEPMTRPQARPRLVRDIPMGSYVLMDQRDLAKLHQRTQELEGEISAEKQELKALHRERIWLEKEKVVKEKEIAEAQARCEELQLLKFGQLVDLDLIDKAHDREAAKQVVTHVDREALQEEKELMARKRELRAQLLEVTERNTKLLTEFAELKAVKQARERNLVKKSFFPATDTGPILKMQVEERNGLLRRAKQQADEIDVLKAEVSVLGHQAGFLPPIERH